MEEELRKQAIQHHIAGESPKAIDTSLDRSKKWFFKGLNRYQSGADDWYRERSRALLTRPSELSSADKGLITSFGLSSICTDRCLCDQVGAA